MKQCTKCRQQIPDDCDICTYCGQWQVPENETQEKDVIKTTKSCVKCKQQIPLDCEECSFCGQLQPVNKEQNGNVFDSYSAKKEKLKKQWKIAGIVFGAFVLLFAGVIALIAMPSHESKSSSVSYYESETEETTVDNSVNGNGYYYFDNDFDSSTVEKFMSAYDSDNALGQIGMDVSIEDFSYYADLMMLGEKVSQYNYYDFNGKTGVYIQVNDDNKVAAFTFTFLPSMLTDPTTTDTYKVKQIISRPASWLYALSDTLTYDEAYDIYNTLFTDKFVTDYTEKAVEAAYYYQGYTMLINSIDEQWVFTIMKTDSDFIEQNNIQNGQPSIFQYVNTDANSDSSSADKETEEETSNLEPVAASDSEIAEAEDLLRKEEFGSDYLGFEDKLNVLDAIYFYLNDATLEATKDYNGNIILKYTGTERTFNKTEYVTYEVDTKNGEVNFIESSFNWEANKDFYPSDLHNDYVYEQNH